MPVANKCREMSSLWRLSCLLNFTSCLLIPCCMCNIFFWKWLDCIFSKELQEPEISLSTFLPSLEIEGNKTQNMMFKPEFHHRTSILSPVKVSKPTISFEPNSIVLIEQPISIEPTLLGQMNSCFSWQAICDFLLLVKLPRVPAIYSFLQQNIVGTWKWRR